MRKKQLCAECLFFGIVLIFAVTLKQAEQPQVNIEKHWDDHSGYDGYHEKVFRLIARKQGKYKGGCI